MTSTITRHTWQGHIRIFWDDSAGAQAGDPPPASWSLAALEAGTELTCDIANVTGFVSRERIRHLRKIGAYIESSDIERGSLSIYDPAAELASFPTQTATYGRLVFLWDADTDGGEGGRVTSHLVSTFGAMPDTRALNTAATQTVSFAVRSSTFDGTVTA